jgi:ribonucleoside-diphosphate reductase alpha chain
MDDVSRHIWETKYRYRSNGIGDRTIHDSWRRIALAIAAAELYDRELWAERFFELVRDFTFLPGGRIVAGAGTNRNVTLLNCFVMGTIEDSIEGIFRALREAALTMQQGGGVGYDFSTLRPRGMRARNVGAIASGPVSFMSIWNAMCETILSTGARRGAMMATLRCDHPDVEEFVSAKAAPEALQHFNLSLQISDAFMEAVRQEAQWSLVFPDAGDESGERVVRDWPGYGERVACRVYRRLPARDLWNRILRAAYDYAEPGVLFVDRINRSNNLWYRERITATNPCGEVPLPPYGACDLGSLNLTQFVRDPFSRRAHLDEKALSAAAETAVRFLDDVIDVTRFPLGEQRECACASRRVGLGITGLGDSLVMLGLRYDSDAARMAAAKAMQLICHAAYRSSVALAREKGAFPAFDRVNYLQGSFIKTLPEEIREEIARDGIRNSHLLAIAPAGTISLLAGNVSSGLEPAFAGEFARKVLNEDGSSTTFTLTDYALAQWRARTPDSGGLPPSFVSASQVAPRDHIAMQAALQPYVDNSISKTILVSEACSFDEFRNVYDLAYGLGLKGCTAYRTNSRTAPVTGAPGERESAPGERESAPRCCTADRKPD